MAERTKTYLQLMREAKNISREALAYQTNIDTSTLVRYDNNPANVPSETMNQLIEALGDEYIGYLYLMSNDVAKRFIPEGVKKLSISHATLQLASAGRNLYKYIQDMIDLASDGEITVNEQAGWISAKEKMRELFKAFIALECADGTEV